MYYLTVDKKKKEWKVSSININTAIFCLLLDGSVMVMVYQISIIAL